jgi:hypothetical protein
MMDVFEEHSAELYSLAYLLTGNADQSVEAFDRALNFDEENEVFGEFMASWARKLIIGEALGTMNAQLRTSRQRVSRAPEPEPLKEGSWKRRPDIGREEFQDAVVSIDAFPRCAMLLTIFEGMSIDEASLLLNEDHAITRKAQRIGVVQLTRNLVGDGRDQHREPGRNQVPLLSLS